MNGICIFLFNSYLSHKRSLDRVTEKYFRMSQKLMVRLKAHRQDSKVAPWQYPNA